MGNAPTFLKLFVGFIFMAVGGTFFLLVCLLLLPWRVARIKACNVFGKTVGRSIMWVSGCELTWKGTEHLDASRPAIYISNHTSAMDVFMAMWLSPMGTVGIAKKEVVYYPFLGQLYLLSGHLRIDRSSPRKAVTSMKELATYVRDSGLSIFIWPEGTRSRSGRLKRPFKKGVGHLALQTGLPIVPVVVKGAHRSWEKGKLKLRGVPIEIEVLPPVDTTDWNKRQLTERLAEIEQMFADALPEDQRPEVAEAA
ncbi:MAG: 1-acyl-sn-glycerol-3-phosphate acyltransferase [Deltaproteobacteria bacterium]|nr:MAG: 1-acyl-sn-glycerol-3-phosphate acyltransferase [Deltaproteobacteria bacterium]